MAKTYQVNFATRMRDSLIMALLRVGVNMGTTSLLTVRGRKSGQPHTVPVRLIEQESHSFLVAPYGVVQWVRNLRAAGTATLTRGRRSEVKQVRGCRWRPLIGCERPGSLCSPIAVN